MPASTSTISWTAGQLSDRPQYVRLGRAQFDLMVCSTGAPQETVISPTLSPSTSQTFSTPSGNCHNGCGFTLLIWLLLTWHVRGEGVLDYNWMKWKTNIVKIYKNRMLIFSAIICCFRIIVLSIPKCENIDTLPTLLQIYTIYSFIL